MVKKSTPKLHKKFVFKKTKKNIQQTVNKMLKPEFLFLYFRLFLFFVLNVKSNDFFSLLDRKFMSILFPNTISFNHNIFLNFRLKEKLVFFNRKNMFSDSSPLAFRSVKHFFLVFC